MSAEKQLVNFSAAYSWLDGGTIDPVTQVLMHKAGVHVIARCMSLGQWPDPSLDLFAFFELMKSYFDRPERMRRILEGELSPLGEWPVSNAVGDGRTTEELKRHERGRRYGQIPPELGSRLTNVDEALNWIATVKLDPITEAFIDDSVLHLIEQWRQHADGPGMDLRFYVELMKDMFENHYTIQLILDGEEPGRFFDDD